ncbi:terminase family protein [Blastococcus sp. CT_GayMR16]|uniref:PBSX family phage terminase large subunit n=1 Tax=Blastococcus sp. CT_GayMR16 TaxID=2559607 RepID=UPI0010730AD5|nr:terminase family protein [Blastococcus sp. CT_GayMR16]TFV91392.1 PBSX family phage terminase large subunit [Blastococcus sp. CT_GayMR16]
MAVYEGSVRSSKTITSLLDWLAFVRTAPPGPMLMIGKTERTLERNVIGPLVEMLGRNRCRFVRGAGELHLLGRLIYTAGANDEKAQEKVRGITLVGVYVDEASLLPESFWNMLGTRLSVAGARLIATTNPDSPQHWLKRDYLDRARTHLTRPGAVVPTGGPVDLVRLSFHLDDNITLDPLYRASLDAMYVGLWRRRFIDGDWVAAEGAIFDMLDLNPGGVHRIGWDTVRRQLTGRHWVGLDYGQSNPFHAVLLGTSDDDRLVVCGEWRYDGRTSHRQLDDGEYEARLRGWLDAGADIPLPADAHPGTLAGSVWPERTAVDPSAASFRSMLRNRGWTGLVAADNAVADGIRNVSSLLAARRLLFAHDDQGQPAAPFLERELLGYVWDPKATKRGEDEPLKADDHGPDGLRYGVQVCRSVWRPWLQQGLSLAA